MVWATHCVGLSGVEVSADDAVFLDLAEEGLCVGVGEGGRHLGLFDGLGWRRVGGARWLVECTFMSKEGDLSGLYAGF